jgi:sec-independent protein translocase protein TatA
MATVPLFVPVPGGMELMIILGLAVLLFGANKIPKLARSSGQAMGEFKRGREELEDEIRDAATTESEPTTEETPRGEADETPA